MPEAAITGQVKALSMIVGHAKLLPDRLAVSSEKKSPPAPIHPQIYAAAWRTRKKIACVPAVPRAVEARVRSQLGGRGRPRTLAQPVHLRQPR